MQPLNLKRVVVYDYPPGQGVQTKVYVVGLVSTVDKNKTRAFLQRLLVAHCGEETSGRIKMWYGRDDDAFERKPVAPGEVDFEPHLGETCDEYDVRIARGLQVYNGRPAVQHEAERVDRREKGK